MSQNTTLHALYFKFLTEIREFYEKPEKKTEILTPKPLRKPQISCKIVTKLDADPEIVFV